MSVKNAYFNPGPAESRYVPHLQTVYIQIYWLLFVINSVNLYEQIGSSLLIG